jgi:hypothetical protein
VRVFREQGALVVAFTARAARLYRQVAGRRVSVICTELVPGDGIFSGVNTGGSTFRAPKRRRPIRTGDHTRNLDWCRVWLPARTVRRDGTRERRARELIASVPLTQRGAVYLDEQESTFTMRRLLFAASFATERRNLDGAPTPAELLDFLRDRSPRLSGRRVTALGSSTETPPAGAVGYYSDGEEHVAAVIVSASGRRLFIEYEPGGVLRTNVAGYMFGDVY